MHKYVIKLNGRIQMKEIWVVTIKFSPFHCLPNSFHNKCWEIFALNFCERSF